MHKRGLQEKSEPGAPQKMTCAAACLLFPIFLPFAFISLPQMGLPATRQKGANKSQQGQQEGGQPTPKGKGKSAEKLTRGEAKPTSAQGLGHPQRKCGRGGDKTSIPVAAWVEEGLPSPAPHMAVGTRINSFPATKASVPPIEKHCIESCRSARSLQQ